MNYLSFRILINIYFFLDSVLTMLEPQLRRIKTDNADIEYCAYNRNSAVLPEGEPMNSRRRKPTEKMTGYLRS